MWLLVASVCVCVCVCVWKKKDLFDGSHLRGKYDKVLSVSFYSYILQYNYDLPRRQGRMNQGLRKLIKWLNALNHQKHLTKLEFLEFDPHGVEICFLVFSLGLFILIYNLRWWWWRNLTAFLATASWHLLSVPFFAVGRRGGGRVYVNCRSVSIFLSISLSFLLLSSKS